MLFWKIGSKRAGSFCGHELYCEDIHALWIDKGIDDYLREQYRKDIEVEFDWEGIAEMFTFYDPEWIVEGDFGDDDKYISIYLTNHLDQAPSGKYWMFWACSNMSMREMVKDTIYWEVFQEVFEEKGYWIEEDRGGDPLDIFVCKGIEEHNPEICGCSYLGNNAWSCGHLDQEQV